MNALPLTIVFLLALLMSILFFPWHITLAIASALSLFVPVIGVLSGILIDALYAPAGSWYLASLFGLGISTIAWFVHHFIKARIMGA